MRKIRLPAPRLFGAEFRIHWSAWLLTGGIAALSVHAPLAGLVSILSYFSMILLHECGHALFAARLGYRVHSIELGALHGRCCHETHGHERDEAVIAWGGVLAQFAVAIPIIVLYSLGLFDGIEILKPIPVYLGFLSALIALLNLAPAPFLDGGRAWRLLPILWAEWRQRRSAKTEQRHDRKLAPRKSGNRNKEDNVVRGPWGSG